MPRTYGSGRLYVKSGAYYARWRAPDGRYVNRRLGKVRARGESDGLTHKEAERAIRRLMELESVRPRPTTEERSRTVDDVADELRERLAIEGARLSYLQNCESMQRIHISPAIGRRRVESVTRQDVERLGRWHASTVRAVLMSAADPRPFLESAPRAADPPHRIRTRRTPSNNRITPSATGPAASRLPIGDGRTMRSIRIKMAELAAWRA